MCSRGANWGLLKRQAVRGRVRVPGGGGRGGMCGCHMAFMHIHRVCKITGMHGAVSLAGVQQGDWVASPLLEVRRVGM